MKKIKVQRSFSLAQPVSIRPQKKHSKVHHPQTIPELTPRAVDLYTSLNHHYRGALFCLVPQECSGGWACRDKVGEAFRAQHRFLQEKKSPLDHWHHFTSQDWISRPEQKEKRAGYRHWIPDNLEFIEKNLIMQISLDQVSLHIKDTFIKTHWSIDHSQWGKQNGIHSVLIQYQNNEYAGRGHSELEALLEAAGKASYEYYVLRKPSMSSLSGEVEILEKGYQERPSIIAGEDVIKRFAGDHRDFIIENDNGVVHHPPDRTICRPTSYGSPAEFYKVPGVLYYMELIEGRFFLIGKETWDHSLSSKLPTSQPLNFGLGVIKVNI